MPKGTDSIWQFIHMKHFSFVCTLVFLLKCARERAFVVVKFNLLHVKEFSILGIRDIAVDRAQQVKK